MHQLIAGIALIHLVIVGIFLGEHHPRLDGHQHAGHQDKFAGHLQIQLFHQVNVLQELLGDIRDRDVVDIELIPLDEEQEQVERTFEIF